MADAQPLTDHLFRTKYGEILAALLRQFGYEHFEAVEEAVQTAFQRALEKWMITGPPENPAGWLYTVARNAYLEGARHESAGVSKHQEIAWQEHHDKTATAPELSESGELPDDLAVMLLLCCNPDLSPKAQVCLTLKAACGFSTREIARALDMQEEAIKKIITRAKNEVAQDRTGIQSLQPDKIAARFPWVMETLYAMFNEGYSASGGDLQLRRDVAEEAIFLADLFLQARLTPADGRGALSALIALMLLQFARFDARTTQDGIPVRLQEQDRSRWNAKLIRAGMEALAASQTSDHTSIYHLEARIAAEHASSPSFAETNWTAILGLYDSLLAVKDTAAVRLSRIVAVEHALGWQRAVEELRQLETSASPEVARSFLFHAVRANLLESASRQEDAAAEWRQALALAPTTADRTFVENKLEKLP